MAVVVHVVRQLARKKENQKAMGKRQKAKVLQFAKRAAATEQMLAVAPA